ncbi:MAG: hypothetical protein HY018_00855 [Hydrogenophilales bacterium]|nr:hypothetical protein [Hydrogenophilales bacterium]
MTFFGAAARGTALQRIVRLGLACACLAVVSAQAVAARVAVVLSEDAAPYQEVYQVIRAHLDDSSNEASRIYVEGLTAASLNDVRLAVAVGVGAADALAALPERPPVLAILVPRAWYLKTGRSRLSAGGRRSQSAIYLDQPFERQALLIRLALPDVRRVGVLLSTEQSGLVSELDEALRAQRLSLVSATLTEGERLITPLETVLSEADLLLALPDPLVFNRNTAQSLFLTSYRYRDPVLGYSRSLTRAGALLSLHSSPAQIGRQAAEWISNAIQGGAVRLPPPAYPSYFSVSINDQVARSLGFTLPSEAELEKRLGGEN